MQQKLAVKFNTTALPATTHPPLLKMRQKRAKAYKRVMALYVSAFGFRTPYQVLISDEFLVEAYKQKDVDILKMVGTTVQGEVKPSGWYTSL